MKKTGILLGSLLIPSFAFAQLNFNFDINIPSEANTYINSFLKNPIGNIYNLIDTSSVPEEAKPYVNNIKPIIKQNIPSNLNIPTNVEVPANVKVNANINGIDPGIQNIIKYQLQKSANYINGNTYSIPTPVNKPVTVKVTPTVKANTTPTKPIVTQPKAVGVPKTTAPTTYTEPVVTTPVVSKQPTAPSKPVVTTDPNEGKSGYLKSLLKCVSIKDANGNSVTGLTSGANFFVSAATPAGKTFIFAYSKSYVQEQLDDELGFIAPNVNDVPDSIIQKNLAGQCYSSNLVKKTTGTVCCTDSSCTGKVQANVYTSTGKIPASSFGDCSTILK